MGVGKEIQENSTPWLWHSRACLLSRSRGYINDNTQTPFPDILYARKKKKKKTRGWVPETTFDLSLASFYPRTKKRKWCYNVWNVCQNILTICAWRLLEKKSQSYRRWLAFHIQRMWGYGLLKCLSQARTQGGFRWVHLNPPLKLMIFIILGDLTQHCCYPHATTCTAKQSSLTKMKRQHHSKDIRSFFTKRVAIEDGGKPVIAWPASDSS